MVLYGSEAPARIDAEALLSSENLLPAAKLNKVIFLISSGVSLIFFLYDMGVLSCDLKAYTTMHYSAD